MDLQTFIGKCTSLDGFEKKFIKQFTMLTIATSDSKIIETEGGRKLLKTVFNIDVPENKSYKNFNEAHEVYKKFLYELLCTKDTLEPLKKHANHIFDSITNVFSKDKQLLSFIKKLRDNLDYTSVDNTKNIIDILTSVVDSDEEKKSASRFIEDSVCKYNSEYIEKDYEFKNFLLTYTIELIKKTARASTKFDNIAEILVWSYITQVEVILSILGWLRSIYGIQDKPISEAQISYVLDEVETLLDKVVLEMLGAVQDFVTDLDLKRFAEFNICKLVQMATIDKFADENEKTEEENNLNKITEILKELSDELETVTTGENKKVTVGKISINKTNKEAFKKKLQKLIDEL